LNFLHQEVQKKMWITDLY